MFATNTTLQVEARKRLQPPPADGLKSCLLQPIVAKIALLQSLASSIVIEKKDNTFALGLHTGFHPVIKVVDAHFLPVNK